jgi:NADPH:quinone reductase-like Zn-dependent oxidoreductase
MGIVDSNSSEGSGLGIEGAGVIRRVGPGCQLKVGDRVAVIGSGTYSTRFITVEDLCVKIPDNLGFEDAATMPCVYSTVIYSLINVGQVKKGDVSAVSLNSL